MSISPMGPRPVPVSPPCRPAARSALRQGLGEVVGWAGQVVGGATAALPGAVVGGLYASQWERPKADRHSRELGALLQAGMSVGSSLAQQNALALLTQTPGGGLSLSNWGSAVAGSAWQYYSGGSGDIADRIYRAIDQEVPDASHTPTMVGKGMMHGLVEGTKGGAHEGKMQGIGMVEGAFEGVRDGWQGLQGKWDPPSAPNGPPVKTTLAREILDKSAGFLGGVVGAGLYAVDGAARGAVRGVLGDRPSLANLRASVKLQAALAGAAGGALLFGPLGAVGGLMVGQWAGNWVHGSGSSAASQSLTRALDESLANDPDLGDTQANTYRNTLEGALVGCLVGARNGLKVGSQGAKDGLASLIKLINPKEDNNQERGPEKP